MRGAGKIGTTGRGIGPAYEDKVARRGIRLSDLTDESLLRERVSALVAYHNVWLEAAGEEAVMAGGYYRRAIIHARCFAVLLPA